MVKKSIPLFKIFWDNKDVQAVSNVIRNGFYWTTGPRIKQFEDELSQYFGTKYAVTFNSGTSALQSAVLAHDIKDGDEVIVPSFTFIATANVVLHAKATPVFADIERDTNGLDPEDVEKKITRKTKAIIPVHYGGSPCKIKELKEIAEDYHLILIEDAAESMGAKLDNKKVGTFGDSAMISFCQNKIITTGEGGAVITDSKEIFEKLKLLRSHGRIEPSNYFSSSEISDYITLGYNYRMSDVLAALGSAQLSKIDKIVELRRKNADYLSHQLSGFSDIRTPSDFGNNFNVYQLYTILLKRNFRNFLLKHLTKAGISVKIYFDPIHLTHFYKNVLKYDCKLPVTEEISNRVLTLPIYPSLTTEEMDLIAEEIGKALTFESDYWNEENGNSYYE